MASEGGALPIWSSAQRRDPGALAIVAGEDRWSWGALDRRASQWAQALRAGGVGLDDLVAFELPNCAEFFALAFGVYRLGATPAPLSPKLTNREFSEIIGVMKPKALVTRRTEFGARVVVEPGADAALFDDAQALAGASWKACTSGGSTGRPKVIIDGRPAAFPAEASFIDIPKDGAVMIPGPLYHNAPFSAAVFALWRGCAVVAMQKFDAESALQLIENERVEWSIMVPTMMRRILALPAEVLDAFDLSSWRCVVHTAAAMPPDLKRRWIERFGAEHIWEVYGATEGLVRTWIGGREWLDRPGSVGRPLGGAKLKIVGERGQMLAAGEVGEIYAMPPGGAGSTYRYLGAERRADQDGWESVGDFGWLDEDGYLFLADRRADLIISGGVNVWPAEVEAALLAHPNILSAAVIGLPDDDLGQRVHAVIEAPGAKITLETLRGFLCDRLSGPKLPRSITVTADPVRDDAGKVRKSALRKQILEKANEPH